MSKRISVTFSEAQYAFIVKLTAAEHRRSYSETVAAIVARAMPELRQEWRETGQVASLPPSRRQAYDAVEEMLLPPEEG